MDEERIRDIVRSEIQDAQRPPFPLPLDIDSLLALKVGGFILFGALTLSTGSATLSDRRIRSTSIPVVSYKTHSDQGALKAACTDGTLTVESTDASDASAVNYLIIL